MIVCKSYVVGQFIGYIGNEEYCLADGSTWKITTPIHLVRKKKDPPATVYRDEDQHFLRVKGMPHEVEVEPVYLPRFMLETPIGRRNNPELPEQLEIGTLAKQSRTKWNTCKAIYEQSLEEA